MQKKKKNASESVGARIIRGLQEFADALKSRKPIASTFTCRRVVLDLEPTPYDADLVKETRQRLQASQAVFAKFLGVSVRTVRAWEQGVNTPSDMASRFMDEIRRDPKHWLRRLREAAAVK